MFFLRLSILISAGFLAACDLPRTYKDLEYPFAYGSDGEVVAINLDGESYPVRRRAEIPPPQKITDELIVYEVDFNDGQFYCATYMRCRNELMRRLGHPVN